MTSRVEGGRRTNASSASSPVGLTVTQFLVEVFVARADAELADRLALDAKAAADRLHEHGIPIQYVRSIFVPDEETCFILYQAATVDDVVVAAGRAGLPLERTPVPVMEWRFEEADAPTT